MTAGFQPGDLIILAARPSVGKTALALNIARNAAESAPVLVFSLEMSAEALGRRMLATEARIDAQRLRVGEIRKNDYIPLAHAANRLTNLDLLVDDEAGISVLELRARARRHAARQAAGLIVVDYLQLLSSGERRRDSSREQEVAAISRGLKQLAKNLRVPVLALSQLNRAAEQQNRAPRLSDLRESGSLEQDADVILFLHEPELDTSNPESVAMHRRSDGGRPLDLIIGKQRNGPTGSVQLLFFDSTVRFENYAGEYDSAYIPGGVHPQLGGN
jgi:replicative DNA helicase